MNPLRPLISLVLIVGLLCDRHEVHAVSSPLSYQLYLPVVLNERLPSPFVLIKQAEKAGSISAETALLYRVYATIDVSQLPTEYRGDSTQRIHYPTALRDAARHYKTASPELQAKLAPYLVPPIYAGSWWDIQAHGNTTKNISVARVNSINGAADITRCDRLLNADWSAVEGQHVKVWYVTHTSGQAAATSIASEVDTVIWPKLTALMAVEPLSDTADLCNGGDERLDIYVAPISVYNDSGSLGFTSVDDCGMAPYIFIKASQPTIDLDDVVAHEFMHTLQGRYLPTACPEDSSDAASWLDESTATWSESYMYPNHVDKAMMWRDCGATYLQNYAHGPMVSDDTPSWYCAYLFHFYLTHRFNDPSLIRKIYELAKTHPVMEAVDLAIPGGFLERWPEFARYNLNTHDLNYYAQWDGLNVSVLASKLVHKIDGNAAQLGPPKPNAAWSVAYLNTIYNLSARYVSVKGLTETVHSVLFDHPNSDATEPTYRVEAQLLFDQNGSPAGRVQQDWTHQRFPFVCVDESEAAMGGGNALSEIALIASNSDYLSGWMTSNFIDPRVILSTLPCDTYSGSTTMVHQVSIDAPAYTSFTTQQIVAQATFKRVDATLMDNRLALGFRPISGTLTLNWSTKITTKGPGRQTVFCGGGPHHAPIGQSATEINSFLIISETLGSSATATRTYLANAASPMTYTDIDCFGQSFTVDEPTTWLTMGLAPQTMNTSQGLIAGTYSVTHTEGFATGTDLASWSLSAPDGLSP